MADELRVEQLLDEIMDSERTPEEVCREFPELLPEVRKRWRQICATNAELNALFPTQGPEAGAEAPASLNLGTDLPRIPGYEVEAVLGRGGMGVVYKARHLRLKRPVAVKMLLAGAYADPQERARFQREAEAIAGLRHANVVQVYDVGDHEGRPYFTMEFVEGGGLDQKLAGTPQPAREAAALVATLAEAVEVAHQGGIVHRDLKPANVLLTADGTPKISDFGLARRLEGEAGLTQSGVIVGTPSYMAPEQAQGKTLAMGPAVDVYALGAILYEMLTGRPPFRGETASDTVFQVIYQEPVSPSRWNAKVPRDLETICLKCLHKDPQRRYVSAAALGEDLRRFLQGEAIAARPEGWRERLVRWLRRRPALVVAVMGILLLAVTLSGGGLWVRSERAAKGRAQEQLDRLDQESREQAFATRLDAIHLNRAAVVGGRYYRKPNKTRADREYEAAFREAGFGEVHDDPEVVGARVRASKIRASLVAALDDWTYCAAEAEDQRRQGWLLEVARRADLDPMGTRQRLRDPAAWKDRTALTELTASALATKASVELLVALGERLQDVGGNAIPFLKAVQQEYPGDFWANYTLGTALMAKNPKETIRFYQAALALRPGAVIVYNGLGWALMASDQLDEAIDRFQQALRIEPEFAMAHTNLGVALDAKGQRDEAIEHFQKAIAIDPKLATAHYDLGIALHTKGRKDEAIEHFQQAIVLDPTFPEAHNELGISLAEVGRRDEAIEQFQQAIAIDPRLIDAHCNLGLARLAQSRPPEAIEQFQQAIAIDPKLAQPHGELGRAFLAVGRFRAAQASTRRCLDLLPAEHPLRAPFTQQLQRCEYLLALESRLPAVLRGESKPTDATECLQFAELFRLKTQYAAAAQMFVAAFAEKPVLADNLEEGHRYNAACVASLAGCGRGEDAGQLTERERSGWRKQAHAWLRADLLAWRNKLESDGTKYSVLVRQALTHWHIDPDLEGLRESSALDKLPADEQKECLALWEEVATLLKRAEAVK